MKKMSFYYYKFDLIKLFLNFMMIDGKQENILSIEDYKLALGSLET